jgi:hypothetical protein
MRFEKIALLGTAWGLLQTGLLLLVIFVTPFGSLVRPALQLAILASAGISVLVGYWSTNVRSALVSLVLAQVVGFLSFYLVGFLLAPDLWILLSILLTGLGLLLLFVGAFASILGAYFRERFRPARTRIVGWRFHGLGLLTVGVAAMLPLQPYAYGRSPVGLWGSTLPIIPVIGALVFAGLISVVFGFRRTSNLGSERVGLMVVAGVLVLGLSLISIGFTYTESLSYSSCWGSCQDFQITTALLASSLLTSSGAIVACLFSDQKESLIGNPNSQPVQSKHMAKPSSRARIPPGPIMGHGRSFGVSTARADWLTSGYHDG